MILQYDNARPLFAKSVKETLEVLNWEVLLQLPYSPGIVPSDYDLFRSMHSAISGELFSSHDKVTKLVDEWVDSNELEFFDA